MSSPVLTNDGPGFLGYAVYTALLGKGLSVTTIVRRPDAWLLIGLMRCKRRQYTTTLTSS